MKIVHVITGLGQGGAEAVLYRLIAECEDPTNHCVISLRDEGVYAEPLREIGVSVVSLDLNNLFDIFKSINSLRRLLLNFSPDVIQTWMYHADLIGGIAGRFAKIPVVWGLHNSNFEKKYMKLLTRIIVRLCALVSGFVPYAIVSCSKTARDLHVQIGYPKEKFKIIPNGLNISNFKPDLRTGESFRSSIGLSSDSRVFVNVARFHPQKDHRNLIRAFDLAFRNEPRAHLILCGSGMDENNLEVVDWLAATKVKERVHLLGSRSDIPKILAGAHYFVLSSVGEAFPCAVAEAMACEVPCVVTDVGDCRDMVGDTGWVVPPLDSFALSRALQEAMEETEILRVRRGAQARSVVVNNFEISAVVKAYKEVWGIAAHNSI